MNITWFVAATTGAVLIQAGILVAMFITMRQSAKRMEALTTEVKTKALPTIETAQALLTDLRPKLNAVLENLQESTTTIRSQVERMDATVSDVVDRARLQVIRADELLTRTLDRVEQTSEMVQKTVVSPVRQVSGIMQGITAGLEFFLGNRNRKNGDHRGDTRRPVPQDEMFI